jgi:hypothetical protein
MVYLKSAGIESNSMTAILPSLYCYTTIASYEQPRFNEAASRRDDVAAEAIPMSEYVTCEFDFG